MAYLPPSLTAVDLDDEWEYAQPFRNALSILQYSYPVFLLVFFLVAFTVRSIAASKSNSHIHKPTTTGPGGKPLPATDPTRNFVKKTAHDDVTHSQKLLFTWLSLFAAATFVGNAAVSISHAVVEQTEYWWAGNNVVVCFPPEMSQTCFHLLTPPGLSHRLLLCLLPVPHLAGRLEAVSHCRPSSYMDHGHCARRSSGRPVHGHLHPRTRTAHAG